jgi:CubicO group peptidase (beta-lactamase class C family)
VKPAGERSGNGAESRAAQVSITSAPPTPDFTGQDERLGAAFAILEEAIKRHAFPAASVAVTQRGKLVAWKSLGRFTYEQESCMIAPETVFDLASVTKVVATTSVAMIWYERGLLELEMPIAKVLPEFASGPGADLRRREVTFRQLLAHSSGLPAYEKLYLGAGTRDELLASALGVPLKYDPGTRAEYSDVGFILLGAALEKFAGERLGTFSHREIFARLGMLRTAFNPPPGWKREIAPTADDRTFRKRTIQGEVQDENASVMGGVAGHAGLFSTAYDLAIFANVMLHGGASLVRAETLELFTRRESSPRGTSRALGWDTPSAPSQSGRYFSPSSFGHLGYTGTSLWIDPERQLSITLLTNRTWPDCSSQAIKDVRPIFHDAVIEAL